MVVPVLCTPDIDCNCMSLEFEYNNTWNDGFSANIFLHNNMLAPIEDWSLTFELLPDEQITDVGNMMSTSSQSAQPYVYIYNPCVCVRVRVHLPIPEQVYRGSLVDPLVADAQSVYTIVPEAYNAVIAPGDTDRVRIVVGSAELFAVQTPPVAMVLSLSPADSEAQLLFCSQKCDNALGYICKETPQALSMLLPTMDTVSARHIYCKSRTSFRAFLNIFQ